MRLQTLEYCEHIHFPLCESLPRMLYKDDDFCVHTCQRFYQALLISTAMYQTVHEVHYLDNITTTPYVSSTTSTNPPFTIGNDHRETSSICYILTGELLRRSFLCATENGKVGFAGKGTFVNTMIMSKSRSYQALLLYKHFLCAGR
jgi:hypothetical protein